MNSLKARSLKSGSSKSDSLKLKTLQTGAGLALLLLAPGLARGCACGCGIFEVGTSSMLPTGAGGTAFFNYDYQNQNQNWSASSQAASGQNPDKNITTSFLSSGVQYMFNRSWGVVGEVPWAYRSFTTTAATGKPVTLKWWSLGDIRLQGLYTGFSDDLSSGLEFGVKLPTGSFSQNDAAGDIDRDTDIGTGSTDALLGGFHRGTVSTRLGLDWFAQGEADLPGLTQGSYRPGFEFDGAAGINYRGFELGRALIAPLAQVLVSERTKDSGAASNSPNSGYTRVLLSPGLEIHLHPVILYADVEAPVFQHVNGNQLVAATLFKVNLSYMF